MRQVTSLYDAREATSRTKTCEYVFYPSERQSRQTCRLRGGKMFFSSFLVGEVRQVCSFNLSYGVRLILTRSRADEVHEKEDRSSLVCVYREAIRV